VLGLPAVPLGVLNAFGEVLFGPLNPVPVVVLGKSGGGTLYRPLSRRGGSWHPHSSIPVSSTLPTLSQGLDPISFLLILEF
jgi:hypothetical protein